MNIVQLKTFLVLAECLNVTETSVRMNCTQPAVSARIRNLEEECNVLLFDRIGKRVYLTKQGAVFRDYVKNAVDILQTATDHLKQMDDPLSGCVKFGATNFIGTYFLPPFLGLYRRDYPNISFEVNISCSSDILGRLEDNSVEFVVLSDQISIDESRYHVQNICDDEMILVVAPDHPLAESQQCTVDELENYNFLLKGDGSSTHGFVLEKIHAMGGRLGSVMHISSTEAIKQGVMYGLGISFLSRFTVSHEMETARLCEVPLESVCFKRKIRFIYREEKRLSAPSERFLATLLESMMAESPRK
ncbi:LysR family transcriptional regulator [Halomonas huangheensis]|uniref:HTH lysR-type domain-containing protein n=1 Tax=Halomonas huangheensis TaxID=1178482 RepID=W1N334_9GAMM|nr:LysR family transcriptional regulator [Halomonas huangheensis]ALM51463.1 hypothetical protein AR456_03505 [Halomonas huangheensis]ERL49918.1 hypothetical protein BJB45_01995 [Halomonas huangheensis]